MLFHSLLSSSDSSISTFEKKHPEIAFPLIDRLNSHVKKVHVDFSKPHECAMCEKCFRSIQQLNTHLKIVHDVIMLKYDIFPLNLTSGTLLENGC